jgi:hypothetical protein
VTRAAALGRIAVRALVALVVLDMLCVVLILADGTSWGELVGWVWVGWITLSMLYAVSAVLTIRKIGILPNPDATP